MKKKLSTRIFSIFLSLLMVVSILPAGAITASATNFVARTTKPATNDYHYYSDNAYYKIGYGMPNCTAYAWGRAYELLGRKPNLSMHNANTWYSYNKQHNYYKYGTIPKVGAIACWNKNYGHVAVVEGVNSNGTISISESNWSGRTNSAKAFRYFSSVNPYSYYGSFQGYIYILDDGETGGVNKGQYDKNANCPNGTYRNTCNSGANMRNAVGTKGTKIIGTVPKNAEIYVYETDGNWGKITFANKVGWVCLDNFTKVSIPVPAAPSISYMSSENIAVGKSIIVNWNTVSGADSYTIGIRSVHVNQDINVGNSTSYSYTLSYAEKYEFYVKASNVAGSSNWSSSRSCTAHNPVTVNFVDWDDSPLGSQTIDYGASAAAPSAPQRKGYTFQGWNDSFYNVTANKTIKATYKINTYIVNFFDREGTLIDSQKVTYGSDATPPTDTHENSRYKFLGWNSTDYINVYTDRADKNINIDGVYTWYNYDLPTVCTIKSATRQYDGYYVTFDIENNDSLPTTGRAVVALKTAEGKLVDMTESTAFSIPAGKIKSGSYYNYDNQKWFTQTRVNGLKTQYRSRYQIAEYYKWTDWGIDALSSNEKREYESNDVYRYCNKNYHIVYIDIYGAVLLVEEGKTIDTTQLDNIDGYDFKGLYTDEELTNKFDVTTPITESITLFTEYSPKKYNVIFQMQDGTELDTQTVEYMQSATAPDTDVVPGYVFGGWDKEFDCITDDTVITGKYFKESEYARIFLDKANINIYQGNSVSLIATISPSNLTDEKIEWTTSDSSVVIVDDTGKVTAVAAGTATITAKVVKTKETATCTINVSPDDSNFIVLKSDSSLNYDSLGYLRRISLNTSVETASKEFTNDSLKFYNLSGTELKSSDYVGTGTQIKLFNGSNAVDTKTVVVTGDMTGDGIINNRDVAMMNKKLVDKADAQECQMLAIDVNGDGSVDNKDAAMVARYLVGKDAF